MMISYGDFKIKELTERQCEVLTLTARGHDSQQVAAELFIETSTVNYHLEDIRARLCARNTTHAVTIALFFGFISIAEIMGPLLRGDE